MKPGFVQETVNAHFHAIWPVGLAAAGGRTGSRPCPALAIGRASVYINANIIALIREWVP